MALKLRIGDRDRRGAAQGQAAAEAKRALPGLDQVLSRAQRRIARRVRRVGRIGRLILTGMHEVGAIRLDVQVFPPDAAAVLPEFRLRSAAAVLLLTLRTTSARHGRAAAGTGAAAGAGGLL